MTWLDNSNNEIRPNGHFSWGDGGLRRILVINDLRRSDEGTYTCIAKNYLGEARGSLFLTVKGKFHYFIS